MVSVDKLVHILDDVIKRLACLAGLDELADIMMIIAVCQRGFLNLCEVFHIQLQWQRKWSKRSKNPHKHGIYRLLPPPKPICTPL